MPSFSKSKDHVGEFVRRYVDSIRLVFSDPKSFFLHKSEQTGYLEPTLFSVINIVLTKLFYGLLMAPFTLGLSLVFLIPSILYQLCLLVIVSVILFGIIRFFNGKGEFESVYRSVAYSSTAMLLLMIPVPFISSLLFIGGMGYLLNHALCEAHGLNQQQACIALIAPLVLLLLINFVSTLIMVAVIIQSIFYILTWF